MPSRRKRRSDIPIDDDSRHHRRTRTRQYSKLLISLRPLFFIMSPKNIAGKSNSA
jgi:hypothetical protein